MEEPSRSPKLKQRGAATGFADEGIIPRQIGTLQRNSALRTIAMRSGWILVGVAIAYPAPAPARRVIHAICKKKSRASLGKARP